MTLYAYGDPADPDLGLPGHITVRAAEGMDAVEVVLRYDGRHGTRTALLLLARAAIEVCARAREVRHG